MVMGQTVDFNIVMKDVSYTLGLLLAKDFDVTGPNKE
jgi:hypothetical protein